MSPGIIWFLAWTALLALALFFPVSRLVWVLSTRRLERKAERHLDEAELAGQKRRANLIAAILVVIFAALFNINLFGVPGRP